MCIVSSIMATSIAGTIASQIATAASAIGSGLASVGIGTGISASTAATIGSTITATGVGASVGAGSGALLGAATSSISGGDIGKGALMGAAGGAATGGVLSGAGELISSTGGITIHTGIDSIGDISIGKTTSGVYNAALNAVGGGKLDTATNSVSNIGLSQLKAVELADQYGINIAGSGVNDASVASQISNAAPSVSNGLSSTESLLAVERANQYGMSAGDAISSVTGKAATDSQISSLNNTIASYGNGAGAGLTDARGAAGGFFDGLKSTDYAKYGLTAASLGTQLYGSYIASQSAIQAANAEAEQARMRADEEDSKAEISAMQAEMNDLKQAAETAAAAEEKEQLAKRRRAIVGKGKVAAAANGVMLESRAESSPAMFEQDAAAELAYEQGKVDYNLRIKNATHAMNAAMNRVEGATHSMGASIYRSQADYAKRLGNLRSTSSWIQGLAGSAMSLASMYYK